MKKILILKRTITIIIMAVIISSLCGCTSIIKGSSSEGNEIINNKNKERILDYDEVKNSLIRFHVIANSDTEDDQELKLAVKDKVIEYLYPYLNASQSLEESRQIIKDRMQEVKKIAEEVIKGNNYKYNVKVELSRENFPDKSYGNITLPQGNYEAFRVIIGSGQGKNWWCVMFPPLCFVDESKAQVEYDKTEAKIKETENKFEFSNELNLDEGKSKNQEQIDEENNNVQVKFKIVEIFKNIFSLKE